MVAVARPGQVDPGLVGDHAAVEDEHAVGEQHRLVDVVGDEQDAGAVPAHRSSTSRWMVIRVSASRALNGSSSRSRSGSRTRARASEARWASPPDRVSGQASAARPSPTSSSAAARPARGLRALQPERDVGEHPLPRHQTGFLEGDGDGAVDLHLALGAGVEAGERAQQRGLARAAAAEQGDELARAGSRDRRRREPALAEGPGEAAHRRGPPSRARCSPRRAHAGSGSPRRHAGPSSPIGGPARR